MRVSIRTAVFSLLLSTLLWLSISLQAEYEVTVPVRIEPKVPSGYSLETPLPQSVSMTLRGTGWNLLNAVYLSRSVRVTPLLAGNEGDGVLNESELRSAFLSSTPLRIISVEPRYLAYRLGRIVQKKVPVRPRIEVQVADGYVLARPLVVVPDSVVVMGSAAVIDTIRWWLTEPLQRSGVQRSWTQMVELVTMPIVQVVPQRVVVKATVDHVAELTYYDVPVQLPPQLPPGIVVEPSHVTITVRGGLSDIVQLSQREQIPVAASISIEQLRSGAEVVEPRISAPAWLQSVTWQPRVLVCRQIQGR